MVYCFDLWSHRFPWVRFWQLVNAWLPILLFQDSTRQHKTNLHYIKKLFPLRSFFPHLGHVREKWKVLVQWFTKMIYVTHLNWKHSHINSSEKASYLPDYSCEVLTFPGSWKQIPSLSFKHNYYCKSNCLGYPERRYINTNHYQIEREGEKECLLWPADGDHTAGKCENVCELLLPAHSFIQAQTGLPKNSPVNENTQQIFIQPVSFTAPTPNHMIDFHLKNALCMDVVALHDPPAGWPAIIN